MINFIYFNCFICNQIVLSYLKTAKKEDTQFLHVTYQLIVLCHSFRKFFEKHNEIFIDDENRLSLGT